MALVTLLTDSGESDHYVAAIKAKIMSVNPGVKMIDITHRIASCDVAHAAFVLKSVFRDFPKGTVHLVGVDTIGNKGDKFIAVQLEDHFFVTGDNGLLGLISDRPHQNLVELNVINAVQTTFPEKDILAPAAAKLASEVALTDLGPPLPFFRKSLGRSIKATRKQISGHVIRIDQTGNAITNIPKDVFETLSAGKNYSVQFAGEKIRRIHTNYNMTDQGECFLIFNSLDLLEIGVYKGNAHELCGLYYDSPVNVIFEE